MVPKVLEYAYEAGEGARPTRILSASLAREPAF
jgi:hypothetical protein